MRLHQRCWILIFVATLLSMFYVCNFGQYLSLDAIKAHQAELEAWRAAQPLLAGATFFMTYLMASVLPLSGFAVMTLAVGAVFGVGCGTVLVSFASTIGATVSFLFSRWLLGDWVKTRFGEPMATLNAGMTRDGGLYLFTLRLMPALPFFVINLIMGLTAIRTWTFYWVSQVGMFAGTLVYVNASTQLVHISSLSGIVSLGLLGSLVLLGSFPLIARKIIKTAQTRKVYVRWKRPRSFDRNLVVIGGDSAGLVTAYIATTVKAKVTLVEKHQMGGDCLNTGCVPSKALIRSAKSLSQVQRSKEFGIRSPTVDLEFAQVMERVQRVIKMIEPHDSVQRYADLGVDVAQGSVRIVTPWAVEITHADGKVQRLTTRAIVIAAGARPFVPPISGIELVEVLTSDNVWQLRQRPERLVVLGGGPIGSELKQTFARLGSKVTQVEIAQRILLREDPEVSELVTERFRSEGVDVLVAHTAKRIEIVDGGKLLIAEHLGREVRIPFDALLVAVGRSANRTGYGLQELGVTTGCTVQVNGYLQTNFANIYAAGGVTGPYQFTHTAAHQAWYAAVNALFDPFKKFRADYRVTPWATFIGPEVARVGLNELKPKEGDIANEVTRYNLDDLDRAIADGEPHGFVKMLAVPGKDRILGVTIVGEHAGELLAGYVLAIKNGIGLIKFQRTSIPTQRWPRPTSTWRETGSAHTHRSAFWPGLSAFMRGAVADAKVPCAMKAELCIVLPVLNEAETLASRLNELDAVRQRGVRVIVVDGGSDDNTLTIAQALADSALRAPRGRASQMNAGATLCTANILLFLHADTRLPEHADIRVLEALSDKKVWGRFDVRIDSTRPLLRMVETLMNLRSRWTGIATGDQAIFVRRDVFTAVNGFPDIPLMEDIALSSALKRYSPPACLRDKVVTSARRWQMHGVLRTMLLMLRLRAAYFFGADPAQLALKYGYRPRPQ